MDKIVLSTMSSPQQTLFEHFKISTNKGSFVSHFNPHTLTTYTRAVNKMTKIPEWPVNSEGFEHKCYVLKNGKFSDVHSATALSLLLSISDFFSDWIKTV